MPIYSISIILYVAGHFAGTRYQPVPAGLVSILLQTAHCVCSSLDGKIHSYTAGIALSVVRSAGADRTSVYAIAEHMPQMSARQSNML